MPPQCRFCKAVLEETFVDLGQSPLANSFLDPAHLDRPEPRFPLHVYVCGQCFLVQLPEHETPGEIFDNSYAYFSSFTESWLKHAQKYVDTMTGRLGLGPNHQVIEIASNDGYLLQYFVQKQIPAFGIEPSANVAAAAEEKGVATQVRFFGTETARDLAGQGQQADLLLGNNVLAHVPDLNDFVRGLKIALKPDGWITMEFPHLVRLMEENQFDTIYHEHFSYFSFLAVDAVFKKHGLLIFDCDELPTHGGSLRIYAGHAEQPPQPESETIAGLKEREEQLGIKKLETYRRFHCKVEENKKSVLKFLHQAKQEGKRVAGYGAPAKGNTLLNYCGVGTDLIEYTVDRSPHKQGKLLPGTHIPVYAPEKLMATRPDYIVILPWNIKDELMNQLSGTREWGAQLVTFIPDVQVHP
ncbi:MAG: methyltransferase domain-containing protein [Nitrospinaceae bacterium]|nr:class I SAM-dependent methyltransferase [Nitrospinaceae bacterium]NIR56554.1 class I SAM-dependent methyltransferase [Nitrospinaceae bacterium]NIS87013.1 class I SAM-dependent methyltransferase [Nitrospinaceae bacterium]NIT83855.1 class I SAM-dependent methyltransferase [Nitrospinaceae bacterium]NIU46063.1 class I SAM-dependent methyltransferase [Nitrospinaceae bacterium]